MGNESSLLKKCTVGPKARHATAEWQLYDASYAGQNYSLFVFNDDRYFNDITRWKHIRHPNLVKCYEAGLGKGGKKSILTEPITPIRSLLPKMHEFVKLSGLFNIGEVLSFLHQTCGISVNNLSVDSIFVSRNDGNEIWKLGSLYWYSSLDSDSEDFFRQLIGFHTSHGTLKTLPPEDREMSTHKLIRSSKLVHRRDSYAFASLVSELLYDPKNPPKLADMILASECEVSSSLALTIKSFVDGVTSLPADQRPTVAQLLNDKLFVNCIFLQIRQFFINFGTHTDYEKCHFFETFIERLRMLPDQHLKIMVFSMIVSSRVIMSSKFIYNHVMPYFLIPSKYEQSGQAKEDRIAEEKSKEDEEGERDDEAAGVEDGPDKGRRRSQEQTFTLTNGQVVTLSPIISTSIYREYIIPHISKLFCVHDLRIRILLLLYLPHYGPLIGKSCLRKIILPQILLGIKDSDNELVSLTFRALAVLVDNFGVVGVLGGSKRQRYFNNRITDSSQHDGERTFDDRDNLSTISAKSNCSLASSSFNFLNYKMPVHMISERSSPDGDEIASGQHPLADGHDGESASSQLASSKPSSNNLNLVDDDDEWPDWENGHDSSSNGFETAVESLASSETIQSVGANEISATCSTATTPSIDGKAVAKGSAPLSNSGKGLSANAKALTKKLQTFDIKEIDFKEEEHKEVDNLFLDMEPVFDFRQSKLELTTRPARDQSPAAKANLSLFVPKLDESEIDMENSNNGWNDEDALDGWNEDTDGPQLEQADDSVDGGSAIKLAPSSFSDEELDSPGLLSPAALP